MGDLSSRRGRIIGLKRKVTCRRSERKCHLLRCLVMQRYCALLHRVVEALLWSFLTMRKFHPRLQKPSLNLGKTEEE